MYDNVKNILDFDELLFETRNKDYGAYQLRKRYNSIVIEGIILASLLTTLAVVIPFILTSHNDHVLTSGDNYIKVQMENLAPPPEEVYVPPAPPPPMSNNIQEIVEYLPPVVVDSVPILEKQMATTDEVLAQSINDIVETKGNGTDNDFLTESKSPETNAPFVLVEVMPTFKGGDINKFREWVQQRTKYPQEAIDNNIHGRIFLTFIIEPDGAVSDVTVVKGVDPIIDNEALKAIQSSPKWTPGLQRGLPVRVRYSMWVTFLP